MLNQEDLQNSKNFIAEMFPNLQRTEIEALFTTTQDINIIITRILDGSYKCINFKLKELTSTTSIQKPLQKDLYFPELFCSQKLNVDMSNTSRNKTDQLYDKIKNLNSKVMICKDRSIFEYLADERDRVYRQLDEVNRKRAIKILSASLQKLDAIDLHGLYAKEALMFLSDFISIYNPKKINLITGCSGNSQSLRPSVINFLEGKKYKIIENDGPYIKATKH